MKLKVYVFMALLSILFAGCTRGKISGAEFSRSFIYAFVSVNTVNGGYSTPLNALCLNFDGDWVKGGKKYDDLCAHFGDMNYNRDVIPWSYQAVADEFLSVDITSDLDFDAAHPAGASLADIVMLHGASPYKYIRSNYTDLELENPFPEFNDYAFLGFSEYHQVYKLLSELTAGDLTLLYPGVILRFTVTPPPGEHNFTLTFRAADKTLEQVVKVVIP